MYIIFLDRDYIITTPRHSGLSSAVAFPMLIDLHQHLSNPPRRPKSLTDITPLAIIITYNLGSAKETARIFSQIAWGLGISIQGFWQTDMKLNVARCVNKCDILVVDVGILKSLMVKYKVVSVSLIFNKLYILSMS